jgi:outer membrane protein assembly factor BamB
MLSPLPPIVVNGVVFSVAGGNPSAPAVLYALDAMTGKELWNSGATITSFVKSGGLSAGGSQIYLGTSDGTLYAFGFPMEH